MTKKSKLSRKKPTRVSRALLEKHAHGIITELLTTVLKTAKLRTRAGIKLAKSGTVSMSLDLEFVTSAEMKKINLKHRGKNKPTDVLSFPAHAIFQKSGHLGDVVICMPILSEQAQAQGHAVKDELRVLLTHGVLHLLHFDHEKGAKYAREMAVWEQKLVAGEGLILRTRSRG